jgi:hypothetical protein
MTTSNPLPKPRIRIPHRVNYHVWSVKTITITALVVITVTALSVFLLGRGSLFRETELTLAIVAAGLFLFLTIGLHRGVRVKRWDLPGVSAKAVDIGDLAHHIDPPDLLTDFASGADGIEGCLGAIIGFVLSLFAGVILLVVLWCAINLGIIVWVFLMAALSWVFYLALRQVFAKSDRCRGKWGASAAYAAYYTLLYTGWLFALVLAAEWVFGRRLHH